MSIHAMALRRLLIPASCLLLGLWPFQPVGAQGSTIGSSEIVKLVENQLLAQLEQAPMARGANRVEVVAGALDSRLSLGACAHPVEITADLSRENRRVNARVSCGAPSPWALYVPAELRVYRDVLVTARAMQRGESFGSNDVMLEERDVLAGSGTALTRLEEAIGLNARRAINANTVLSAALVESPVLVRRGDSISVSARSGGVSVQTSAVALADGRSGERIRVRNLRSDRVIDVRVTGPATAEVF
jgi:flagellar basal body P-ring formation protein FlgA